MSRNEHKYDPWKRKQHEAVRNSVGWYCFTHHIIEISGKDAAAFLDMLYVNNIAKTKVGGAKYTTMLNEDAIIIDDVVVFRLEEEKFWVSTLFGFKLEEWIDEHSDGYDIEVDNISADMEMYAVQGPNSKSMINDIVSESVDELKFFNIRDNTIDGISVKVSRAGFSGELGYEIYVAKEHAPEIEAKLAQAGVKYGAEQVTELQVMAHTLPTEVGFNLMTDLRGLNPLEADPAAKIFWDKDFIGKKALERASESGIKKRLVGFEVADEDAAFESRHRGGDGEAIVFNGEIVGRVTKFTYGFTVEKCIGYAIVDTTKVKEGDKVTINGYEAVLTGKRWYDPSNRPASTLK